jgi:acyl carrier protein
MNNSDKKLDKKNIEDILSLTPVQEGMLFFYLKDPADDRNFEQLYLEISGAVEHDCFKKAWQFVADTNEMLRTVFRWEKVKKPVQMVLRKHTPDVRFFDLTDTGAGGEGETGKRLEEIKRRDSEEKFDLRDVPFRVTLCKTGEKKYGMILSNHHILYDGWSNGIILKEFFDTYGELVRGGLPEKRVKTGFKHFIQWLRSREVEQQKAFWQGYLEGFENTTPHGVKPKSAAVSTAVLRFEFPAGMNSKIDDFVKKHKITLPALLYSAWGILLRQYNGSGDLLFDTTVSGRTAKVKGIEDMVGLFINTLPVRVTTRPDEKVIDILERMKKVLVEWEEFENTSLVVIKEYLDTCVNPVLFDSVVVIENYPLDVKSIRERSGLTVDSYSNTGTTGYDLTVLITVSDGMRGNPVTGVEFTYNADVFNRESAVLVRDHFIAVLEAILSNPRRQAEALDIIPSEEEKNEIISYFVMDRETGSEIGASYAGTIAYEAPRSGVEKKLAAIWSDVLNLPPHTSIGINDNFFTFGGHSLKASLLAARLHKEFNVRMPLVEVFRNPTIREMAGYIERASGDTDAGKYLPLRTVEQKGYYPLASVQQRMYSL